MASTSPASAGSGSTPIAPLVPLALPGPTVTAGFWADRLRVNRKQTLPHGFAQLRRAGNLTNLGLAAGAQGRYKTLGARVGLDFPFLDTDVYKWLEAAAWELGRLDDDDLRRSAN